MRELQTECSELLHYQAKNLGHFKTILPYVPIISLASFLA